MSVTQALSVINRIILIYNHSIMAVDATFLPEEGKKLSKVSLI